MREGEASPKLLEYLFAKAGENSLKRLKFIILKLCTEEDANRLSGNSKEQLRL